MSAALRLELRPSPGLAAAIVAAHAAAALSIALLAPTAPGILLALALLALGCATAWHRALLRGRKAARALLLAGNELSLELADGGALPVTPARRRYVSRLLVTVPLGARTLLVSADMLSAAEFRRLRVWALWGRLPGVAGGQLAR